MNAAYRNQSDWDRHFAHGCPVTQSPQSIIKRYLFPLSGIMLHYTVTVHRENKSEKTVPHFAPTHYCIPTEVWWSLETVVVVRAKAARLSLG